MNPNIEEIAENFLEFSSEQRLKIIISLAEKKSNIASMAKELQATNPEIHRNFTRLLKAGLIEKDSDGNFHLSIYGRIIYEQIPLFIFASENKEYFKEHNIGNIPKKFIFRIGQLNQRKHVKGFVRVLEKWKEIHDNAEKYIYNILAEVPYSTDIIDIVEKKLKNKIKIQTIFAQNAIVPDERKTIYKIKDFNKYVKDVLLERRMLKSVSVVILMNEKESCVIFPKKSGMPDMSEMFYGSDSDFHEWCSDYFNYCWENSTAFQESKLE